jgi:ribosomal protein S18 acetylase RimI-like enzyme
MPSHDEIIVRKAVKTDVKIAADLIYSSGIEICEYLYKTKIHSPVDFIRYGFSSGSGFYNFNHHWVSTLNDEVVGIIAFWSDKSYDPMVDEDESLVREFFGEKEANRVFASYLHLDSLIPFFGTEAAYIADVAVSPAHHGSGIGNRLLSHVIDEVRSQGIARAALDVSADNPAALALYQKHGFIQAALNSCSDPSASLPKARRMILEIVPEKSI